MEIFLKNIAQTLLSKYQSLENICLVFPNKRSSLFFKKYLGELIDKPIWSPATTTINELMQDLSEYKLTDNMQLIFDLYTVYSKHKKSHEPFDEFYFWGDMMLSDFDDIDKYLVNPKDLFKNLQSIKSFEDQFSFLSTNQIEAIQQFWRSFDPEKISSHQKDFISIWNVMNNIYADFNSILDKKGEAYEGKIYRDVAGKIDNKTGLDITYDKYIFAGFNALNNCERKLFSHLQNLNKAEFYWDYDEYYIKNEHHEAGRFIRENIKLFPQTDSTLSSQNLIKEKEIELISVPSNIGQTKILDKALETTNNEDEDPNTNAIVLADEELLLPVLHSTPNSFQTINITMGLPLNTTPVFSLIENLIELQKNVRINKKGEVLFYYKNVSAILNHTYLNTGEDELEILNEINRNNLMFLGSDLFEHNVYLAAIFKKIDTSITMAKYLTEVLHQIYLSLEDDVPNSSWILEKEFIYHIFLAINRLSDILNKLEYDIKKETFWRLLKKIIRSIRIPFSGEPLSGLQIMGILETRLLDFKNLTILSMNEGVFPKTNPAPSFIPYNLRRGFGLPTIEHQDAIYAYYFYRLIQRAENVTLIYNSKTEGIYSGEMSRYLYQLKYELKAPINEQIITYDIGNTDCEAISIEKNNNIIDILKEYTIQGEKARYFSPSALAQYLMCKLRFYFNYIAGIKEPFEILEEVDAPMFGSILHQVLNLLYKPFTGKKVTADDVAQLLSDPSKIDSLVEEAYKEEYFKSRKGNASIISGRNLIIKEIILSYVKKFLNFEKDQTPFQIIGLENRYTIQHPFQFNGKIGIVNIGGTIDRVDQKDNKVRILDYKTGKKKDTFKSVDSLFSEEPKNQNSAVFQTLLYSHIYKSNVNPGFEIQPGLYFFRNIYNDKFDTNIKLDKTPLASFERVEEDFLKNFNALLSELFDPAIPFTQTEDEKICQYCPYMVICHK